MSRSYKKNWILKTGPRKKTYQKQLANKKVRCTKVLCNGRYYKKIYNSDKIFDSRFNAKAIRVKDYVTVTAAQFEDCLENGTTYNFTLRQAISNPYVGGDPQMNTRNDVVNNDGFYWYRPTFKLTSSTNLRMYRTVYKWSSAVGWGNPPEFQRYQDCLITLLDA